MAERKKAVSKSADWTTLKGKYFHSFDKDGFVSNQGYIIDFINEEVAIVQYFEWFVGTPSTIQAVWLKDIIDGKWALYSSVEVMRDSYEHHLVRRRPEKVTGENT